MIYTQFPGADYYLASIQPRSTLYFGLDNTSGLLVLDTFDAVVSQIWIRFTGDFRNLSAARLQSMQLDYLINGSFRPALQIQGLDFSTAQLKSDLTGAAGDLGPFLERITAGSDFFNILDNVSTFVDAGAGNDTVSGTAAADTLLGGTGDDLIKGNAGADWLSGGEGNDTLEGGVGNESVTGTRMDVLYGGPGDDVLRGSIGSDSLLGGTGDDSLYGGAGGNDTLSGDDGRDFLQAGPNPTTLSGGNGDDTLWGGVAADFMQGGDGADLMQGFAGNDRIDGNAGADTMLGGDGNDTFFGGAGADALEGGMGNDSITGEADDDTLRGGDGNDTVSGGDGNDLVLGEGGDDTLISGIGRDTLDGGSGDDYFIVPSTGSRTVIGGPGTDTLAVFQMNWSPDYIQHSWTLDGKHRFEDRLTGTVLEISPSSDIERFLMSPDSSVPITPVADQTRGQRMVTLQEINQTYGSTPIAPAGRLTVSQDLLVIFDTGRVTDLKVHQIYEAGVLKSTVYSRGNESYTPAQIEPYMFVVEVNGILTEGFRREFKDAFPQASTADLDAFINHDARLIGLVCGADGNFIG